MSDPHEGGPVVSGGVRLERARLVAIMLHGRGGSADDILSLSDHFGATDIAFVAPEARGRSWWPQSFLAPHEANEPHLSSALSMVDQLVSQLEGNGVSSDRIVLCGFSQGACLALEHAARTVRQYYAVFGLSGGLVGTGDAADAPVKELYGYGEKTFDYSNRKDGMTVYMGRHERDPHIPLARVDRSAELFKELGANVTVDVLPGAGHGIVEGEIERMKQVLAR